MLPPFCNTITLPQVNGVSSPSMFAHVANVHPVATPQRFGKELDGQAQQVVSSSVVDSAYPGLGMALTVPAPASVAHSYGPPLALADAQLSWIQPFVMSPYLAEKPETQMQHVCRSSCVESKF